MYPLTSLYLQTPDISLVNPKQVITNNYLIKEFDLKRDNVRDTEFYSKYKLEIKKSGNFTVSLI